jgi:putative FmdB family regulatory protein
VPTYEYECLKCRRVFEIRQPISAAPLKTCDVCGGEVRRLLSPAPFILKGKGWYVTDYPSAARKKALESEKSDGGADKKVSEGKSSSGEKPSEKKASGEKPSEKKASGEKPSGEQSSTSPSTSTSPATAPSTTSSGSASRAD